jgi:hypothetical protein
MTSQPPPSPPIDSSPPLGGFDNVNPDDELLVAYLDGELDQGSARRVENQLASDPRLRRRLNDLRVAWDLLEDLPPAEPNPKFAQSTIEMVAMSAASLSEEKASPRGRWRWAAALLALLPLMFGTGYALVRAAQRLSERQTLEIVHVLADWDALEDVGTYAWLQKIRQVDYLGRVAKRPASANPSSGLVPQSLSERRAWIEGLSATNRDRLSANLVKFKRASPEDRQRIIELARQIYEGPDPPGDLQAARDYSHFLSEMSISDRIAYKDQKDETQRLDDLTRRVNRRMVEVYTQELTPDSPDRQTVLKWIEDMQDQYGSVLGRGGVVYDLKRGLWSGAPSVIGEDDLEGLLQSLTPEAQEILSRIRSKEAQHAALIVYFIDEAQPSFPGRGPRRALDRAELVQQFESLGQSAKSQLEFLPAEKAQESLGMRSETGAASRAPRPNPGFTAPFGGSGPSSTTRSQIRDEVIESRENEPKP